MKRAVFILAFLLIGTSFVSAYGTFAFGNIFDYIEPATFYITIIFLVCLVLINFALGRAFRNRDGSPNKGVAGPIAILVSLGIAAGIYRSGLDYENFFSGATGIQTETLYPILMLIVLGLAILLMFKFGIGATFLSFGILFVGLVLIGAVYQSGFLLTVGIVLIIIGGFLLYRRTRKTYYLGRGF